MERSLLLLMFFGAFHLSAVGVPSIAVNINISLFLMVSVASGKNRRKNEGSAGIGSKL